MSLPERQRGWCMGWCQAFLKIVILNILNRCCKNWWNTVEYLLLCEKVSIPTVLSANNWMQTPYPYLTTNHFYNLRLQQNKNFLRSRGWYPWTSWNEAWVVKRGLTGFCPMFVEYLNPVFYVSTKVNTSFYTSQLDSWTAGLGPVFSYKCSNAAEFTCEIIKGYRQAADTGT